MCGIAGYCASREFAETYIKDQSILLREAWYHNIHRGHDAAGFMGTTLDGEFEFYRNVGQADELFAQHDLVDGAVYRVFGTHTREASNPQYADDLACAHPQFYKNTYAIHNGNISNDVSLLKECKVDNGPPVDTFAIPVLLSGVDHPENVEAIAGLLRKLHGGYAIHVSWMDHPDYMLLARGTIANPLLIAYNAKLECVVYGSEEASIYSIIREGFDLDPRNADWDWRSVDPRAFIIFRDGHPLVWGSFSATSDTPKEYRIRPSDNSRMALVSEDNQPLIKHAAHDRSMLTADSKDLVLLYDRSEKPERMLHFYNKSIYVPTVEAEMLVRHKTTGLYHMLVGDVEIVMNLQCEIVDIYDHRLDGVRWERMDEKDKVQALNANVPWEKFRTLKTTLVAKHSIPAKTPKYKFLSEWPKRGGNSVRRMPARTSSSKALTPNTVVNPYNIERVLDYHKDGVLFFLDGDVNCTDHAAYSLISHPKPFECKYVKTACAYVLAGCDTLDTIAILLGSSVTVEVQENQQISCKHLWTDIISNRQIALKDGKYIPVPEMECCYECGTTWEIVEWPKWLENLFTKETAHAD